HQQAPFFLCHSIVPYRHTCSFLSMMPHFSTVTFLTPTRRTFRLAPTLIANGEVVMIGPIRQEILSGIKNFTQYEQIKNSLRAFPSHIIEEPIFEMAASCFNLCRSRGIQGSHTDFLICACSIKWKIPILSKDKDFVHYAKHIPIELYQFNE
ncbi:MAG: hypothetical protein O2964_19030, partial [Verrucomicrobia bacterium]|nr:hypothetical protein [Verrucomicrobiota bacterium]